MKPCIRFILPFYLLSFASPLFAQESDTPTRTLKDRSERGTLTDRIERVRGDSGKWRDEARLQVSPPIPEPAQKKFLDGWADALDLKNIRLGTDRDTWLIFRTAQLDDNDRLWIEKIERKGNQITVILNHAVWQGDYSKNFTWYGVYGVNLGKLPAGDYEAKWIVKPLVFLQFEDPKNRRASWPKDERAAGETVKPKETTAAFTVAAP